MTQQTAPHRISDLVKLKRSGMSITCQSRFQMVPLEVDQDGESVRAFIFLCQYSGTVDGASYAFRKCYARACSGHRCATIYQAVMTAKPYAQADYQKLQQAGIHLEKRRMTLDEIVNKFEGMHEAYGPTRIIHDYIHLARQGHDVRIDPVLNRVSAQEHVDNYKIQRIFLLVVFGITCNGETHRHERCFACYAKHLEKVEKREKTHLANDRLKLLYDEFERASIVCEKRFFIQP